MQHIARAYHLATACRSCCASLTSATVCITLQTQHKERQARYKKHARCVADKDDEGPLERRCPGNHKCQNNGHCSLNDDDRKPKCHCKVYQHLLQYSKLSRSALLYLHPLDSRKRTLTPLFYQHCTLFSYCISCIFRTDAVELIVRISLPYRQSFHLLCLLWIHQMIHQHHHHLHHHMYHHVPHTTVTMVYANTMPMVPLTVHVMEVALVRTSTTYTLVPAFYFIDRLLCCSLTNMIHVCLTI
jgi:hypothetical protein